MKAIMNRLISDESGQDLIEYALVAGLVGLVSVTALQTLATDIAKVFTAIDTDLTTAAG
ncbi:Flp family type IVb pilin [Silvibacterium dinghuense]|uniref:Flp family type IVb pilin n=1 Tax=Silvibacterium dinghuense TaxID=1560006 RepID=A0A4Q1SB48_9BACT|nr:Flp family type IVb pilin [Silvibacterium dinghuense]RXS93902.1 Flp family type IVb pilin [Silvibacterium dinghuense]